MTDVKTNSKIPVRLKAQYQTEIRKQLMDELKLSNINEVPKLEKIVLNIGLGKAKDDKKAMEVATTTLKKITGQTPVQTLAKISVAGFKLREGNKIGLKVTLRGDKMYEFLDRLINIVLPRLRDFHGLSLKSFDKQGNYSIGIVDQTVFPEITFEDSPMTHGLQAVIVTNSLEKEHCKALLEKFGLPFEKESDNDKGKEN